MCIWVVEWVLKHTLLLSLCANICTFSKTCVLLCTNHTKDLNTHSSPGLSGMRTVQFFHHSCCGDSRTHCTNLENGCCVLVTSSACVHCSIRWPKRAAPCSSETDQSGWPHNDLSGHPLSLVRLDGHSGISLTGYNLWASGILLYLCAWWSYCSTPLCSCLWFVNRWSPSAV